MAEALEKNNTIFQALIGYQIVGVERYDGRLLVMLTNGDATKMLEIDRYAKIKQKK